MVYLQREGCQNAIMSRQATQKLSGLLPSPCNSARLVSAIEGNRSLSLIQVTPSAAILSGSSAKAFGYLQNKQERGQLGPNTVPPGLT